MITGAAGGIGAATVQRFLREGACVAAMDLNIDDLSAIVVDNDSERILVHRGDCTDEAALAAFHAAAQRKFGPVDVLFNSVGQSARERAAPFDQSAEDVWRFVLEVSLVTTMRLSSMVAPEMRKRGGSIINMGSDAAFVGDANLADYAAAKMGVVGFSRALSRELASYGVTVNVIAPGAIKTKAHETLPKEVLDRIKADTPARRVGTPGEVAGVVAFLASADARFITGQTILINGGRWML